MGGAAATDWSCLFLLYTFLHFLNFLKKPCSWICNLKTSNKSFKNLARVEMYSKMQANEMKAALDNSPHSHSEVELSGRVLISWV